MRRLGRLVWVVLALGCGRGQLEHAAVLDFGDVAALRTSELPLILANTGTAALTVTAELEGAGFSLETARVRLGPGASTTVAHVRFSPTVLGPRDGALVLRAEGVEARVALTGRGVGPSLVVPERLSFGTVPLLVGRPVEVERARGRGGGASRSRPTTPSTRGCPSRSSPSSCQRRPAC